MIRNFFPVVTGYLVFALSSMLLFTLTSHDPHEQASIAFKLITIGWGLFFSVLAGFVVQWIGKPRGCMLNFYLAIVMFLLAATSMLLSPGSHWTQLFAMFIFAPASFISNYFKHDK
jgi:hypothetical protein